MNQGKEDLGTGWHMRPSYILPMKDKKYIYEEMGIQVIQTLPDKYVSGEEENLLHHAPENKVKVP